MNVRSRLVCCVLVTCASTASAQGERFQLVGSDTQEGDSFGWSCAAGEGYVLVGALYHDGGLVNRGAVYVYDAASGAQVRKLVAPDATGGEQFGYAVAVEGDVALVGARYDDDLGSQAGSAYLFDLASGALLHKLLASDGAASDHFGASVALSGGLALVGAPDDDDHGQQSGAAYVFDVATGQQVRKLVPEDGAELDLFGVSVALDGTTALVGAYLDDDLGSGSGSAYVLDVTSGQALRKLRAADGAALDLFGHSVALEQGRALIGAPGEDGGGGAAYVFDAASGQQTAKLSPSLAAGSFGWAVALDGATAIVGAYRTSFVREEAGAGYRFNAATGALLATLSPEVPADHRWLGRSVGAGAGLAVLGAPLDGGVAFAAGSAFVFRVGFGPRFCDGADGALAACPCANPGDPATGCDNAQATGGAALDVLEQLPGIASATLLGTGFPPSSAPAVLVLRSSALAPAPAVLGDGLRCVSTASLVRLAPATASAGLSAHVLSHGAGAGTFHYQLWYRNSPASYCDSAAAFNTSSGVSLTW